MVFAAILSKIETAALAGKPVRLDEDQVRAFVGSPAYLAMCEMKQKELAASWHEESQEQVPAPSSGHSGSGIAPTETSGASVGTMTAAERAAVERAASKRASEAVRAAVPRKRLKTP